MTELMKKLNFISLQHETLAILYFIDVGVIHECTTFNISTDSNANNCEEFFRITNANIFLCSFA